MPTTDNFAHGTYGDDSGVVFYGPPVKGLWSDSLAVSNRYIHPLFSAILNRMGKHAPKLITEWNELKGWTEASGIQEMQPADARALAAALVELSPSEIAPYAAGESVEDCFRCAAALAAFILKRVEQDITVYTESD